MRCSRLIISLSLLALLVPGAARGGSCLPGGSVPEMEDNHAHGWLSPLSAAAARGFIQSLARGTSRWQGDSLITTCTIADETFPEATAAEVSGGSTEMEFLQGRGKGPRFFTDLAARTGHTSEEGEAMARRYAQLGFFRYVDDGEGGQKSEADVIYSRHSRALGLGEPHLQSVESLDQGKMQRLQAKIEAAKQRGDMNEMMRLAMEAQQMTQPVQQEVAEVGEENDQLTWRLLEEAYGELAAASYKSRIVFYSSQCLQCDGTE